MHPCQRDAEQRRETRATGFGLGEGQALVIGVARLVVGRDGVDRAIGQGCHNRQPVRIAAQRRGQLRVGAVVADRGLVQVEIGGRGVAGDGQPLGLCAADQVQRGAGRDMGEVDMPAREPGERDVAGDEDRLRRRGNAGQAEARGELTLRRGAAGGE